MFLLPKPKPQQMLGREKARFLFMEEGAGQRNEKKTAQGAAWQKPFLLSVTRLGALPCGASVPGGDESANFRPLRRAVHGDGGSKPLVRAGPENPQVPVPGARCRWGL